MVSESANSPLMPTGYSVIDNVSNRSLPFLKHFADFIPAVVFWSLFAIAIISGKKRKQKKSTAGSDAYGEIERLNKEIESTMERIRN